MKKIINLMVVAGLVGLVLSACKLDKTPTTAITSDKAFLTFSDATNHRTGLYALFRGHFYGVFAQTTEFQSDLFNAYINFGNRGGVLHRLKKGEMLTDYDIAAIWASCYSTIANVNNFLTKIENFAVTGKSDSTNRQLYIAEAHYFRAYLYYILAKHFCEDYEPTTNINAPNKGLPLVTEFNVEQRLARATIGATYNFILAEIQLAKVGAANGAQKSNMVTRDAVFALESKICLLMHKNEEAAALADSLIEGRVSGVKYPLATADTVFRDGWEKDNTTEDIFAPFVSATEGANTQYVFEGMDGNADRGLCRPDWIPTETVVQLYTSGDWRYKYHLNTSPSKKRLYVGNRKYEDVKILTKWPRTDIYDVESYRHRPKVARIAEQYLILTEALINLNKESEAATILNQFRAGRGLAATITTSTVEKELHNEWVREFIGEGVRIECLKRWKMGFDGRVPQNSETIAGGANQGEYSKRKVDSDEFFLFTLPIPANEMRTNGEMKQNAGY